MPACCRFLICIIHSLQFFLPHSPAFSFSLMSVTNNKKKKHSVQHMSDDTLKTDQHAGQDIRSGRRETRRDKMLRTPLLSVLLL